MIFIQIAAYRDPELLPTIKDCLEKAKYPNDLRFGICWQRGADENCLEPFLSDSRFRIETVPWKESRGLCWARSRIQKLYDGETFTLQLDSHHRFTQNWDEWLMNAIDLTSSDKPLLSSYASPYDPNHENERKEHPFKMVAQRFTKSGTILFLPHTIPNFEELTSPINARFVSGHYFFTLGQHCTEYKYDPELYFAGDELSLSVRSYTLGYDLFHPHRNVVWHEYTRTNRTKHWDDHTSGEVIKSWHQRDQVSKKRLRNLIGMEDGVDLGIYGLGSTRSLSEYERYAGIDFKGRRFQSQTLSGDDPPCEYQDETHWENGFGKEHQLTLQWNPEILEDSPECQFVFFGVEDEDSNLLYRYDALPDSPEFQKQVNQKEITFTASSSPTRLVIWPYFRDSGWAEKTTIQL